MHIGAVINSQQLTKIFIDQKQKDASHLFFYPKKKSSTQEIFLEKILFCNFRKQSSIRPIPHLQVLLQKFYSNKTCFCYKLGDRFVLEKCLDKASDHRLR